MSSTSPWISAGEGNSPAREIVLQETGAAFMQTVLARRRERRATAAQGRQGLFTKPQGLATYLILRPLSDLFLWVWRLERRTEFLYRPWFDKWLRPPLFSAAQAL